MSSSIPPLADYLDIQGLSNDQFWALLRLAKELKDDLTSYRLHAQKALLAHLLGGIALR